jgi:type I restriction enzyme R subunit
LDRYGREVPDEEYQTKDFERVVALRSRTRAMAKHLSDFLKGTDRFAKTLVFCVDQEHAAELRQELLNLNSDLVKQYPDYVCRVTADEGAIGLTHLAHFQDVDKPTPVILTTSQLLTTGVDAEMVKNVVLARVVGSRSEFKQIIGRGTRLKVDYGKEYFNIIDFTGTATSHFADPDFDGEPARIEEVTVDESGEEVEVTEMEPETPTEPPSIEYELPEEQIGPDTGILINEPPWNRASSTSTAARSRSLAIWSTTSTPTARSCRWCATPNIQAVPCVPCTPRAMLCNQPGPIPTPAPKCCAS